MKKETNLCMGCMNPMPESPGSGECDNCGWSDKGIYLSSYLSPSTFLADRYIVGKLVSYNGEAALHIGYDALAETKVIIKEYMPDALCSRKKDVLPLSVNQDCLPLYKTYLSEFIDLNRSLRNLGTNAGVQNVLDVFSENGTAYAVYEYFEGISLKSYLANLGGSLTWEQAKDFFPPVFAALDAVNAAGIIHRGIAPSTIFVNEKLETRLIGFAISAARTYGSEINFEIFAGYAAPEQYNMLERQGSWTDVYGLSALMYRSLTGLAPPEATERLINDTLAKPNMINRDIPANVSDALIRGLALSPDARVKTVNDFFFSLHRVRRTPDLSADGGAAVKVVNSKTGEIEEYAEYNEDGAHPGLEESDYPEVFQEKPNPPRKSARERKKRIKRLASVSAVTVIIVFFVTLIIVAAVYPELFIRWTEPPAEGPPTAATTPAPTGESEGTPTEPELYEVRNFIGERYFAGSFEEKYYISGVWLLTFEIVYEYADGTEKNRIFEQSIKAGAAVPLGTAITLKVSNGPSSVKLPPYTGLSVDAYVELLKKRGIANIKTEDRESVLTEEGFVDGCNFGEGDEIRTDDEPDEVIVYRAVKPPETDDPGDGETSENEGEANG
ncbi:MAG: PASTA domain-containing protein [Oscillospiraceae bacterium]|nr:PASTA domain-containing protein [Oscillospiraceae bacterium]